MFSQRNRMLLCSALRPITEKTWLSWRRRTELCDHAAVGLAINVADAVAALRGYHTTIVTKPKLAAAQHLLRILPVERPESMPADAVFWLDEPTTRMLVVRLALAYRVPLNSVASVQAALSKTLALVDQDPAPSAADDISDAIARIAASMLRERQSQQLEPHLWSRIETDVATFAAKLPPKCLIMAGMLLARHRSHLSARAREAWFDAMSSSSVVRKSVVLRLLTIAVQICPLDKRVLAKARQSLRDLSDKNSIDTCIEVLTLAAAVANERHRAARGKPRQLPPSAGDACDDGQLSLFLADVLCALPKLRPILALSTAMDAPSRDPESATRFVRAATALCELLLALRDGVQRRWAGTEEVRDAEGEVEQLLEGAWREPVFKLIRDQSRLVDEIPQSLGLVDLLARAGIGSGWEATAARSLRRGLEQLTYARHLPTDFAEDATMRYLTRLSQYPRHEMQASLIALTRRRLLPMLTRKLRDVSNPFDALLLFDELARCLTVIALQPRSTGAPPLTPLLELLSTKLSVIESDRQYHAQAAPMARRLSLLCSRILQYYDVAHEDDPLVAKICNSLHNCITALDDNSEKTLPLVSLIRLVSESARSPVSDVIRCTAQKVLLNKIPRLGPLDLALLVRETCWVDAWEEPCADALWRRLRFLLTSARPWCSHHSVLLDAASVVPVLRCKLLSDAVMRNHVTVDLQRSETLAGYVRRFRIALRLDPALAKAALKVSLKNLQMLVSQPTARSREALSLLATLTSVAPEDFDAVLSVTWPILLSPADSSSSVLSYSELLSLAEFHPFAGNIYAFNILVREFCRYATRAADLADVAHIAALLDGRQPRSAIEGVSLALRCFRLPLREVPFSIAVTLVKASVTAPVQRCELDDTPSGSGAVLPSNTYEDAVSLRHRTDLARTVVRHLNHIPLGDVVCIALRNAPSVNEIPEPSTVAVAEPADPSSISFETDAELSAWLWTEAARQLDARSAAHDTLEHWTALFEGGHQRHLRNRFAVKVTAAVDDTLSQPSVAAASAAVRAIVRCGIAVFDPAKISAWRLLVAQRILASAADSHELPAETLVFALPTAELRDDEFTQLCLWLRQRDAGSSHVIAALHALWSEADLRPAELATRQRCRAVDLLPFAWSAFRATLIVPIEHVIALCQAAAWAYARGSFTAAPSAAWDFVRYSAADLIMNRPAHTVVALLTPILSLPVASDAAQRALLSRVGLHMHHHGAAEDWVRFAAVHQANVAALVSEMVRLQCVSQEVLRTVETVWIPAGCLALDDKQVLHFVEAGGAAWLRSDFSLAAACAAVREAGTVAVVEAIQWIDSTVGTSQELRSRVRQALLL